MYHCTPRELLEQDLDTINDHLLCLQMEAEVRSYRRNTKRSNVKLPAG